MVITLFAKNKIGLVDGSIIKLDNDSNLVSPSIYNNHIIISWILNFISKEIVDTLPLLETSGMILKSDSSNWMDEKFYSYRRNSSRINKSFPSLENTLLSFKQYGKKSATIDLPALAIIFWGEMKQMAIHQQIEYTSTF